MTYISAFDSTLWLYFGIDDCNALYYISHHEAPCGLKGSEIEIIIHSCGYFGQIWGGSTEIMAGISSIMDYLATICQNSSWIYESDIISMCAKCHVLLFINTRKVHQQCVHVSMPTILDSITLELCMEYLNYWTFTTIWLWNCNFWMPVALEHSVRNCIPWFVFTYEVWCS